MARRTSEEIKRKNYINAQLKKKFGRSDIVRFLSKRPFDSYEKWLPLWVKMAPYLFLEEGPKELLEIFQRYADPLGECRGSGKEDKFVRFLIKNEAHEIKAYKILKGYLLLYPSVDPQGSPNYYILEGDEEKITGQMLVEELCIKYWRNYGETKKQNNHGKKGIREFLMRRLRKVVAEFSDNCSRHYGRTCAVTHTGTSAVSDDIIKVICVEEDGSYTVISSELFVNNKILKPCEKLEVIPYSNQGDLKRIAGKVARGELEAAIGSYNGIMSDYLIIKKKHVPLLP